MENIKYKIDSDGIAFITWDVANSSVNILNETTLSDFFTVLRQEIKNEKVKGIVINSVKKDFIAGGDLKRFLNYNGSKKDCFNMLMETHKNLRLMETCKKPVVAAINGMALGGGCEVALACHHRIMKNTPENRIGLVECSVGLFPGAGGTQRFLRKLGPKKTIQYITQSKKFTAEDALKEGIIDEICQPEDNIDELAKKWILTSGNAFQPWDDKHFKVPGTPVGIGQISGLTEFFSVSNAMAYKTTHGNFPHIKNVLSAIYYGASCPIDSALEIEARYFVDTLFSKESKNIIRSSFIFIGEAAKGKSKPVGFEVAEYKKIGVLGAGMMGSGIAYVSAKAGLEVVLKDVNISNAEKGKQYARKQEEEKLKKGLTNEVKIEKLLAKIKLTNSVNDLIDCDLIIEAVFENEKLKNSVTKETESIMRNDIVYATNTSTIPITKLAESSRRPEQFIGLHFFSPVEKMPLVEIIVGKKTSKKTIAAAIDFVIKIRKIPIVVNDGRGFFTSRVFGKFVNEGITMLTEGIPPAVIENVAKKIGMPVGPLAISDEVNLKLMLDIMNENPNLSSHEIDLRNNIETFIKKYHRIGKKEKAGFYEYPENEKKYLWKGWETIFPSKTDFDEDEIGKRLLFSMVIDAYKCLDSGVIKEAKDADVGSVLGFGFPIYTGGVLSYIDYVGGIEFVEFSKKLALKFGERFLLPTSLKQRIIKADNKRIFHKN